MKLKKLLTLILFALSVSCSPQVKRTTPTTIDLNSGDESINLSLVFAQYKTEIENPIILLWPKVINANNEDLILKVIQSAKTISEVRLSYDQIKLLNQSQFTSLDCDCVLYGLCTRSPMSIDDGNDLVSKCEKLEASLQENEKKFIILAENLKNMKDSLLNSGGTWIESEIEKRNSYFNFFDSDLYLRDLTAFEKIDGSAQIISAFSIKSKIGRGYKKSQSINFEFTLFDQQDQDLGTLKLDASPQISFMNFQGDIRLKWQNQMRQGILVFQQAKK